MSAKERALKDMRELTDFDTINQRHSVGSVYRAFPEWINYAKSIYDSTLDKISKEKERAAEAEGKADAADRLAQENLAEVRELETKIDELESHVTKLQEAGQAAEECLNSKMLEISKVEDILRARVEGFQTSSKTPLSQRNAPFIVFYTIGPWERLRGSRLIRNSPSPCPP
jgi:hypothetical protein